MGSGVGRVCTSAQHDGGRRKKLGSFELRRLVIQLTRVTYFNEEEVKEWYKRFIKDCPDGLLSEHHFLGYFTESFPSGEQENKDTLARQIFRTFDRDASGSVDFREFIIGLSTLLRGTTVERLKWIFNMYDLDSNGSVTKEELMRVLKMMHDLRYPEMAVENVDALDEHLERVADKVFMEADVDRDGTLMLKEFVEGVRRNPGLLRPGDDKLQEK